jgi:hypothetical protein
MLHFSFSFPSSISFFPLPLNKEKLKPQKGIFPPEAYFQNLLNFFSLFTPEGHTVMKS